ncbi:hypothetical protein BKA70DRAFT_1226075 [Coprinopsis sp. MPI-PUGE-AT-0042]|nr:hypothetical protein BKA70DRAFT_1226075 [Coprinopsis sp. MPI-PUGE-AT-0042]
MLAALHDKPGVVEQLLDLDWVEVDAIDHTGVTALWAASHLGFLQVAIQIILSHRDDVNMVNFEGDTALKAAAAGGHDIIDGRTALTAAIEGGFETIASLLLDFEAEQILEADIAMAGPDSDARDLMRSMKTLSTHSRRSISLRQGPGYTVKLPLGRERGGSV